ncbi:MAG: ATP-binding cassette domain-containing protein [Candidatus Altiarchaeales archaeon]|nr:ATP-binding cassette domain-containing protein [Candidatus Altiarchaeales archaeon]
MELIKAEGISKVYVEGDDFVQALDDVSLNIGEGSFTAFMGPSGCGKSTLLSILGALNTPTGGDVFIDGIAVYDLSAEKRSDFRFEYLGFVFQSFQLIPYLTAEENLCLPLSITAMSGAQQKKKAKEVLSKVGLEGKGNRLPNQISGGEAQRVAIARAIINNPPILLADEPTGNLDTKNGGEIMNLLRELNEGGQTIVMVTHDKSMTEYADNLVCLRDGRVDLE